MARQKQTLRTISPQLVLSSTPIRVSSSQQLIRSAIIESASGNTGEIIIASSESQASTINSHRLYQPGEVFVITPDTYGDLDGEIDLMDIWVRSTVDGDRVVVSYIEYTENLD